jgi:hypothetical protein
LGGFFPDIAALGQIGGKGEAVGTVLADPGVGASDAEDATRSPDREAWSARSAWLTATASPTKPRSPLSSRHGFRRPKNLKVVAENYGAGLQLKVVLFGQGGDHD